MHATDDLGLPILYTAAWSHSYGCSFYILMSVTIGAHKRHLHWVFGDKDADFHTALIAI